MPSLYKTLAKIPDDNVIEGDQASYSPLDSKLTDIVLNAALEWTLTQPDNLDYCDIMINNYDDEGVYTLPQ